MFILLLKDIKSQTERAYKDRLSPLLAWLVIGDIAVQGAIAVLLHVLRPDIDLIRFTVSNYALSTYGLLMTAAFFAFAISLLALALGLVRSIIAQRKTRLGVFLLLVASLGMIVAGIFPVDPNVEQFPVTTLGTIHFLAAMVAFSCITCATLLFSLALKKDERWRAIQDPAFWLAFLAMVALLLFLVLMLTNLRRLGQCIYLAMNFLWMLLIAIRLRMIGPLQEGNAHLTQSSL